MKLGVGFIDAFNKCYKQTLKDEAIECLTTTNSVITTAREELEEELWKEARSEWQVVFEQEKDKRIDDLISALEDRRRARAQQMIDDNPNEFMELAQEIHSVVDRSYNAASLPVRKKTKHE